VGNFFFINWGNVGFLWRALFYAVTYYCAQCTQLATQLHNHSQHNQCRTPHAVVHDLVLLMMGIMMLEICWDRRLIINIRLAASCWFFSLFILYKYLVFKVSVRFEGNVFLKVYICVCVCVCVCVFVTEIVVAVRKDIILCSLRWTNLQWIAEGQIGVGRGMSSGGSLLDEMREQGVWGFHWVGGRGCWHARNDTMGGAINVRKRKKGQR